MKLSSHTFSKLLAISLFSLSFAYAENAPEVTPLGNESLETLISKTSELKGLQTPGSYFKALVYASENVDKSDVIVQIPDDASDYLFYRIETAVEEVDSFTLNWNDSTKIASVTLVGRNYIPTERYPDQSEVLTFTITLTQQTNNNSSGYSFLEKPRVIVSSETDLGKEPN